MSSAKHRGPVQDNIACVKKDQPFGGDLHVFLDKLEADILQNTKK